MFSYGLSRQQNFRRVRKIYSIDQAKHIKKILEKNEMKKSQTVAIPTVSRLSVTEEVSNQDKAQYQGNPL